MHMAASSQQTDQYHELQIYIFSNRIYAQSMKSIAPPNWKLQNMIQSIHKCKHKNLPKP